MRIVSLVPSATEMLFALGLGADVVGVTHECDYPPEAQDLPKVTRDLLPPGLSAAEIDAAVKERTLAGESIYELDAEALHELAPDLIVTQALCSVCAVSYDDVRAIAEEIDTQPMVISLDPHTVGEVLGDARTLAQATDTQGRRGRPRAGGLGADRPDPAGCTRGARRPRVAALEWLDPPFAAGHWTPQLIEYAGGEDVLGFAGENSAERSWEEVAASRPDVVIVMPCGYDAEIAHREAEMHRDQLAALGAGEVVAVDAAAYFSRPGPRIIDGLELLAHILHPELVPEPPAGADGRCDGRSCDRAPSDRDAVGRQAVTARHGDRGDHADHRHRDAAGERRRGHPPPLAELDDQPAADQPRRQPADVAADRDPGDAEVEDDVDDQDHRQAALPDRDPAIVGDDDQRAEHAEAGSRGADGHRLRARTAARRTTPPAATRSTRRAKLSAPDRRLQHRAHEVQEHHVEQDVEDAVVQEAGGQQPVVVVVLRDQRVPNSAPWSYTVPTRP